MNSVKLGGTDPHDQVRATRGAGSARRTSTATATQAGAGATSPTDAAKVSVSDRAAEIGRLAGRVAELPEVRQERVEALRSRVESGSYKPSAEDIAAAILKDEA